MISVNGGDVYGHDTIGAFIEGSGLKKPNRLGVYDMSDGIFEWCWDWEHAISTGSTLDPVGPDSGGKKVLRGGSWLHGWAIYCGVRLRLSSEPQTSTDYYGFRIARSK